MAKSNLRFDNLREAMEVIQREREEEIGHHTWDEQVERYGVPYLFIEIASIVARLEIPLYRDPLFNPYMSPRDINFNRLLDLTIDLGNYADFLYQTLIKYEEKDSERRAREARSPLSYSPEDCDEDD